MSRISTYEVVPVPKLADKLIGTSVGGEIEDITYNFTLLELLNLFIPNIPASGLQGVLDNGNSATQDIILDGTVYTTNLEVTDTATILNSYLNGDTHILGALYDVNNLKGIAGDVLSSTGTGVEWITLPPIFTPNLQQVLEVGNTADIDIILDANIEALDINVDTATINNNITIDGTITDGDSSVGTLNQVLSSTGTKVKWVNLPSYSATSPLFLDSITGVFSIQQSDNTHNGYLSYVDWITFNGKQPAGNYITALTGEATATGPGSVAISLSNPAVIGKVLSGLSVTGGSISATDSILTAFGKVQGQLNALVGGVMFKGVWNASTNNPTLTSSVGTQGWYYIVNVAGNTDLNGITDWQVGDWAIFNGSTWNKIDNTDLVTSVNGQTGAVSLTTDNISEGITNLYYTDTRARNSVSATTPLAYNNISGVFSIQSANSSQNGYLSSTDWSTFNSKQDALSGTGLVKSTTGVISYITDNSSNWDIAYDNSIISAAVTGTSVKTLTLNQQDGGTITATWSDANTGLTSVGLSMPSAFSVSNSPLVSNGTIGVTGAGTASQYIRGDGQLATFPASGGGGSSVSYYLNGGTSQGTIGGDPYEEMSRTAVVGTNTDFNISADGYVASFLTDAGDPALLQIPGGNWNFELFFSASSSGGTPSYYVELYKYDGVVLTLIADNSATPEGITGGTSIDLYVTALAVPQTSLTITDRLAIRVYVTHSGRTITLHTQGTHLCQVITTFSTGISALNGLTAQVQYFATGTAGTDFAINSATATHTFNLPTASATNRGALSTTDWTTFNNKANALSGTNNTIAKFNSSTTIGDSNIKDNGNAVSISTTAGSFGALQVGNYNGSILMNTANTSGGLIFQNTSASNKLWDFSSYNNDINFNESGVPTPVMTLKSGGNIGINTTTPSNRLDIIGTLGATGVVTLGNLAGSGNRMVIADSSGVLSTQVITTGTVTAVTASSPLASSGGNTPNITIQQSSGSQNGYLSSTDWTTFNNKQASGNYITSLTGEATGTGPGATTVTLNNASVTGKVLTGINITGGTVVDTDSILTGFGKLQNQVNGLIGGTIYQGTWNANTNTPALTSGVGVKGYYYIVSVAGTTNLDGITDWFVGDWAIFDGTAWQQVDNTDAVVSVNGQTGAVSLTTDNIPEGATNLYFLDSRARAALSFTAGSGAYNSTTGVITIPTNTSQLTNGANFITLASLNGTSPIVYNNTTGNISINQSGTASNGYLSSTDWNTFNSKQNALTNPITGTGTVNYLPKFTGTTTIGNSNIIDNGNAVSVNTTAGSFGALQVGNYNGSILMNTNNTSGGLIFQNTSASNKLWDFSSYGNDINFNESTVGYPVMTLQAGGNVGIKQVNPSHRLDVDGTFRTTGVATFGSTLSNGTYNYTLPSATGTLALTSQLSSGTVTSVATAGTVSGLTLTGGTITTSGTITLGGTLSLTSGNVTTALGYTPLNKAGDTMSGILTMGTTAATNQYIRMGLFPNLQTNTGEAWIGRASDRNAGTMTVQLGGNSASGRSFEVVDYAWSVVLFSVSSGGAGSFSSSVTASSFSGAGTGLTGTAASLSIGGNASTATALSSGQSNWSGTGVINNVVGMLAWKNYGNSHVIFDASQSTNPSGGGCNNTNSTAAWTATYPTLMGWNGSTTYGVRVDSARVADSAGSATTATYATNSTRLYASDNPYCYGCAAPYYLSMTYDGTRWFLQTSPASPSAVRVSYADSAGSATLAANTSSISNAVGGAYTWTGAQYFLSNRNTTSDSPPLQAYANNGSGAIMSFHRAGAYAVNFGLDSDNVMRIGGWSAAANRWQLDMSGNMTVAGLVRAGTNVYTDTNYGYGLVGAYASTRFQGVFAMGDAYKLPADGSSPGNLYGLSWSYPAAGGQAGFLDSHGLLVMINGSTGTAISNSIWARANITANGNFYTSNYIYGNIYAGNAYGALMYSNNGTTYTQWRIAGSKNGYGGIVDEYSNVNGIMYDNGGNGGVYREVGGGWYWYYYVPNACMGINGSATSSAYGLYVTGSIYTTGTVTQASDVRKKTDIVTIDNALEKVTQMRGVYFTKIGEEEKGRQTGVIAQEMNEILPEVVIHAKDVDEYSVAYGNAIGVLIEAIKEQQLQIEQLKQLIKQ